MTKLFSAVLLCCFISTGVPTHAQSQQTSPQVHSKYSILIDVDSGKVMWARGANVERQIASTTKIMTALLLLERGHLQDQVTAPPGVDKIQESSLHLSPGEHLSLNDLLYAMLLRSANDTAVTGAVYLCGSVPEFVEQMNIKARQIGAVHTHFVTPNGLYAPGHHSTAFDLSIMARYAALTQPMFDKIVSTQRHIIQRSIHKNDSLMINTASTFLKTFPGADGIKTGYIHQAGHCFVSSATRNGWRLIAVALDSGRCREDDMSLLNYGFYNFRKSLAVSAGNILGSVKLVDGALCVVGVLENVNIPTSKWHRPPLFTTRFVPEARLPTTPVSRGTVVGTIEISANGVLQSVVPAVLLSNAAPVATPVVSRPSSLDGTLRTMSLALLAFVAVGIGGLKLYARTITKSTGRSWDRVPPRL